MAGHAHEILQPKHGPTLYVRPLRNGDVDTVAAMFERLGDRSRRTRFNGPKPRLSQTDLQHLAAVDAESSRARGLRRGRRAARGARAARPRRAHSAEIAFEVADEYHQRGIGTALAAELLDDARAAGITEITALVSSDNPAAVALLGRILSALEVRFEGPELSIRAALA